MVSDSKALFPLSRPLTGRELEVLTYIGEGHTNREIAELMTVALSTVKWYIRQIYNKLSVDGRTEAIERARELGILPDNEFLASDKIALPLQLTNFIGRRKEIAEVRQLLLTSRLVTLTGSGGSGKTRLAIQAARESVGQFTDGIHFVALAAAIDDASVLNTVIQDLGIVEQPSSSPIESIIRFIGSKQLLLILDNFEQVLESAPLITEFLTKTPRTTILVTSREMLHLRGEHEYFVPPLRVPDLANITSAAEMIRNESVALFVQQAQAVSMHFTLTDDSAPVVASICHRLDGLPLAIELAASRIKLFTPEQLLDRLDHRLGLLTSGPRDLPERQQTLRNTLDWSYELLEEYEKELFSRIGVFSGGGSLHAIESVCDPNSAADVLSGVESLLNKSLLLQYEDPSLEPRFYMLEIIQEYAREKLTGFADEVKIRDRHLKFYMAFMEEAEDKLTGAEQLTWLRCCQAEHDNLLSAFDYSRSRSELLEYGLRLISAMGSYYQMQGFYSEGRELLATALTYGNESRFIKLRADILRKAGLLAYMQGDYTATRSMVEESLVLYRQIGAPGKRDLADALITLGDMETEVGNYSTASSLIKEALEIMIDLDDDKGMARAYWQLGACAVRTGEFDEAISYFNQALLLLRKIGDRTHIAIALSGLAEIAIRRKNYERATAYEEESITLRREVGEKWGIAVSLGNLSWIATRQGDIDSSVDLLHESLQLRYEIGDLGGIAWCLEKFAEIEINQGSESVSAQEHFIRAATLFGAAAALRMPVASVIDEIDKPAYEHRLELLQAELGKDTFTEAWIKGERFSRDQAVQFVQG